MARTIECTDCHGVLSYRATRCPHCGAPAPYAWWRAFTRFFTFIFVLALAWLAWQLFIENYCQEHFFGELTQFCNR